MARTLAADFGADMAETLAVYEAAKKEKSVLLRFDRRVRYWSDGAVVGTREFVEQVSEKLYGKVRPLTEAAKTDDIISLFALQRRRRDWRQILGVLGSAGGVSVGYASCSIFSRCFVQNLLPAFKPSSQTGADVDA